MRATSGATPTSTTPTRPRAIPYQTLVREWLAAGIRRELRRAG